MPENNAVRALGLIAAAIFVSACSFLRVANNDAGETARVAVSMSDRTGLRFRNIAPANYEDFAVDNGTSYTVSVLASEQAAETTQRLERLSEVMREAFTGSPGGRPPAIDKAIKEWESRVALYLAVSTQCSGKIKEQESDGGDMFDFLLEDLNPQVVRVNLTYDQSRLNWSCR